MLLEIQFLKIILTKFTIQFKFNSHCLINTYSGLNRGFPRKIHPHLNAQYLCKRPYLEKWSYVEGFEKRSFGLSEWALNPKASVLVNDRRGEDIDMERHKDTDMELCKD